ASDLERRPGDGSGRNAGEDSLVARKAARRRERVLVRHGHDLVVDRRIEHTRDEAGADALLLVRRRLTTGQHGTLCRLHGDDMAVGLLLTEETRTPGQCAARTHTCDEHIDPTLRVLPDLRSRGAVVDLRIRRVVELARDPGAAAHAGRNLFRLLDCGADPL